VRVIIPNYLTARTNCITSTSMYHLCCIDQCEGLLSALEREVKSSSAKPGEIADFVSRLKSRTVDAPRFLSESLILRLHEISKAYRGRVPLHSRLFAQWMHYAYPRECPFPAAVGAAKPMSAADWMNATGGKADLTQEEIDAFVDEAAVKMPEIQAKDLVDSDWENTLPWSDEEGLVFSHSPRPLSKEFQIIFRAAAVISVCAATAHAVVSTAFGMFRRPGQDCEKTKAAKGKV